MGLYRAGDRTILHRTPAAAEVNDWASLPLALLGIEQDFAASNEFYNDNS